MLITLTGLSGSKQMPRSREGDVAVSGRIWQGRVGVPGGVDREVWGVMIKICCVNF